MTTMESANRSFSVRQSCGVLFPLFADLTLGVLFDHTSPPSGSRAWIDLSLPLGKERMSCRITEVGLAVRSESFIPRTRLGEKLLRLRNQAVAEGLELLSEDEVIEEIKRRRGELKGDEAHIP
ncbi:MAG: hypothetical protein V2B18_17560 [Pseudomonadota bacterium]